MIDENEELSEQEKSGSVWQYGKDIGHLPSSENSMSQVRKDIIKFALGFDIKDIRTYAGYKGDLLVEIMATDPKVIQTIKDWAENLGMETAVKENRMTMVYELFCITPDEEVYDLIPPE